MNHSTDTQPFRWYQAIGLAAVYVFVVFPITFLGALAYLLVIAVLVDVLL